MSPRHMDREIDKLKKKILALSAVVEGSVQRATQALSARDAALAQEVIDRDEEIDNAEVDVEEECLKLLALYQPVATDLRYIIAILKINNDLERVGDEAVNIAERVVFLAHQERFDIPFDFQLMSDKTQAMLRNSLDALVNSHAGLAHQVGLADDEVDDLNRQMYVWVQRAIREHPERVEPLIHLLSISRHLERIADYATNIAEDVIYLIDGEIVRHKVEAFQLLLPDSSSEP